MIIIFFIRIKLKSQQIFEMQRILVPSNYFKILKMNLNKIKPVKLILGTQLVNKVVRVCVKTIILVKIINKQLQNIC